MKAATVNRVDLPHLAANHAVIEQADSGALVGATSHIHATSTGFRQGEIRFSLQGLVLKREIDSSGRATACV
jgi:hypothetical protein